MYHYTTIAWIIQAVVIETEVKKNNLVGDLR